MVSSGKETSWRNLYNFEAFSDVPRKVLRQYKSDSS